MSDERQDALIGVVCMLSSAVFYAGEDVVIKITDRWLTVWQIGFGRFALGLLAMPLVAWLFRLSLLGARRRLLLFRGLTGTVSFLCLVAAIKTLPLSEALVLFFLFPAFAAMLSPKINKETNAPLDWLFIAGAFSGTVLILWPHPGGSTLAWGHLSALAAAFLAGLVTTLIRHLGRENNPLTLYFYFCLVGAITSLPFLFLQAAPIAPAAAQGWWGLAAIAGLALIGQVAMNMSFKHLSAAKGGVLMMSEAALGVGCGVIFLGEPLTWRLLIGSCLILGCGLSLSFRPTGRGAARPSAGAAASP